MVKTINIQLNEKDFGIAFLDDNEENVMWENLSNEEKERIINAMVVGTLFFNRRFDALLNHFNQEDNE